MTRLTHTHAPTAGYLLVLVLVFGGIFFFIVSSFVGFAVTQSQIVNMQYHGQQALDIAEAGLNHYKWQLAHSSSSVANATVDLSAQTDVVYDPVGNPIGEYTITAASSTYCGAIANIDVVSEGFSYDDPSIVRTIRTRYTKPTVANYSYIVNGNVWAGDDREISGPYHSNGGIIMDGWNKSVVTSGVATWECGPGNGFGSLCPATTTRDGVSTYSPNVNTDPSLFLYPSNPIDFAGFNLSLSDMADRASTSGIYFENSGHYGYHVEFNGNGTVTFRPVTNVHAVRQYNSMVGSYFDENTYILNRGSSQTEPIDPDCPLIYVDDKIWLEGEVDEKVTIAVGGTDAEGLDSSIFLQGNITYDDPLSDGLLAVAKRNVLVGLDVPDQMELNGIFVAMEGNFGRNHYYEPHLDPAIDHYYTRDRLTLNGTVVSLGRVGTAWSSGGAHASGFENRVNEYDRNLVENPPPLVPSAGSAIYRYTDWQIDG
mgnify:CR=1 FL=1